MSADNTIIIIDNDHINGRSGEGVGSESVNSSPPMSDVEDLFGNAVEDIEAGVNTSIAPVAVAVEFTDAAVEQDVVYRLPVPVATTSTIRRKQGISADFLCPESTKKNGKYGDESILSHTNPFDALRSPSPSSYTNDPTYDNASSSSATTMGFRDNFTDSFYASSSSESDFNVSANNSHAAPSTGERITSSLSQVSSSPPSSACSPANTSHGSFHRSPICSSTRQLVGSTLSSTDSSPLSLNAAGRASSKSVDFSTTLPEDLMVGLSAVRYGPLQSPVSISSHSTAEPDRIQSVKSDVLSLASSMKNSPMLRSVGIAAAVPSDRSHSTDESISWNSPQFTSTLKTGKKKTPKITLIKPIIRKSSNVSSIGSASSKSRVSFANSAEILDDGRVRLCPLDNDQTYTIATPVHMSKPPYAEIKLKKPDSSHAKDFDSKVASCITVIHRPDPTVKKMAADNKNTKKCVNKDIDKKLPGAAKKIVNNGNENIEKAAEIKMAAEKKEQTLASQPGTSKQSSQNTRKALAELSGSYCRFFSSLDNEALDAGFDMFHNAAPGFARSSPLRKKPVVGASCPSAGAEVHSMQYGGRVCVPFSAPELTTDGATFIRRYNNGGGDEEEGGGGEIAANQQISNIGLSFNTLMQYQNKKNIIELTRAGYSGNIHDFIENKLPLKSKIHRDTTSLAQLLTLYYNKEGHCSSEVRLQLARTESLAYKRRESRREIRDLVVPSDDDQTVRNLIAYDNDNEMCSEMDFKLAKLKAEIYERKARMGVIQSIYECCRVKILKHVYCNRKRQPHIIRYIEGKFGSGVASLFVYTRWLLLCNLLLCVVWGTTVWLPMATLKPVDNLNESALDDNEWTFTSKSYLEIKPYLFTIFDQYPSSIGNYPLATCYVWCIVLTFFGSLFMVARKLQYGGSPYGAKYPFGNLLFSSWDHSLKERNATRSLTSCISISLMAEIDKKYSPLHNNTSDLRKMYTITLSHLSKFLSVFLILSSLFCMVITIIYDLEIMNFFTINPNNFFARHFVTFVVMIINVITPILLHYLIVISPEKKSKKIEMKINRIYCFRMLSITAIIASFHRKIESNTFEGCAGSTIDYGLLKLLVADFLFETAVVFPYTLLKTKVLKEKPNFDVGQIFLSIIYRQCLIWICCIVNPQIFFIGFIMMWVTFYVNYYLVMKSCITDNGNWNQTCYHEYFMTLTAGALFWLIIIGMCATSNSILALGRVNHLLRDYNGTVINRPRGDDDMKITCGPFGTKTISETARDSLHVVLDHVGIKDNVIYVALSDNIPIGITLLLMTLVYFLYRRAVWERRQCSMAIAELKEERSERTP